MMSSHLNSQTPYTAMMIAAEASSAHYAIQLLKYFKSLPDDSIAKKIHFFGVGSQEMESMGFERFGCSEEMAIVGLAEVIAHYSDLKKIFNELIQQAQLKQPQFIVLLDYPDFNLRLAEKLKEHSLTKHIPIVYYISPQVWAWRQGRVHQIKKYCNHVYLLFPFEVEFYKKFDVPTTFVGHPLLEDLKDEWFDEAKLNLEREKFGIQKSERVLALMPGSRKSEIAFNFLTQLQVAEQISKKYAHVRVMICVAPTLEKEFIQNFIDENFSQTRLNYILLKDDPYRMISLSHYVLATSGTATLMIGLLEKPMVVMYKMKWLTGVLAKVLVKGVKFFCIVNLIFEKEVVKERMQSDASVENLTKDLEYYIIKDENRLNKKTELADLKNRLGQKGATARVAEALLNFVK